MTFQELIFALEQYWHSQGCVIQQPYDMEVGAGNFSSGHLFCVRWDRSRGMLPMSSHPGVQPTAGTAKIPTVFSIIINIR